MENDHSHYGFRENRKYGEELEYLKPLFKIFELITNFNIEDEMNRRNRINYSNRLGLQELERRLAEFDQRIAQVNQQIANSNPRSQRRNHRDEQANQVQIAQDKLEDWRITTAPQAIQFLTDSLVNKHKRLLSAAGVEPDDWEGVWTEEDTERVEKAEITLIRAITRDFSYNRLAYN